MAAVIKKSGDVSVKTERLEAHGKPQDFCRIGFQGFEFEDEPADERGVLEARVAALTWAIEKLTDARDFAAMRLRQDAKGG